MKDGLWQVTYKGICAAFVMENNRVVQCAPILRRKMSWWITQARWVTR